MRDRSEDQDQWRRDEQRRSEGGMRYDYGRDDESRRGGRQEEYGSRREEGHSRWQGGQWQGEYPGREELRRGGGGEREEYRSDRGSRGEYGSSSDRGSERWREEGSGWNSNGDRSRGELSGGRQEQGRWGIGSERSGEGRMTWEDRGDRHRSTDSGEFRGSHSSGDRGRYQERGSESERGREDYWTRGGGRNEGSPGRHEEYRYRSGLGNSERESSYRSGLGTGDQAWESGSRERGSLDSGSRGESPRRDISGTWRQFDSWGDTSYGDSRGQGLGHHRRDSYTSDFWSQGERGDDRDR